MGKLTDAVNQVWVSDSAFAIAGRRAGFYMERADAYAEAGDLVTAAHYAQVGAGFAALTTALRK